MELKPSASRPDRVGKTNVAIGQLSPGEMARRRAIQHLDFVRRGYNDIQSRYADDSSRSEFPTAAPGYQIVSIAAALPTEGGENRVELAFRVRPMPYAYDSAADRGVSEAACQALAEDLKRATFRWFLVLGRTQDRDGEAQLLDCILKGNGERPMELGPCSIVIKVELDRSLTDLPRCSCSTPLVG